MRYIEWKKKFESESNQNASFIYSRKTLTPESTAVAKLFLKTFEKEIPSHGLMQVDEKFENILLVQLYNLTFGATVSSLSYKKGNNKIKSLLARNPYKLGPYVDFVKKIRENRYLSEIVIYRKSKNWLVLEFDNVKSKDMFEFLLGYENFTQNHPVTGSEYPQRELNAPQILKFYVHESKNGELAIPFPCQEIRDNFYNLLNIQKLGNEFITKGQNTSLYFKDKNIKKNVKISIPVPDHLKSTNYLETRSEELVETLRKTPLFINALICLVGEYANSVEGEEEKPLSSVKFKFDFFTRLSGNSTQNKTKEKVSENNTQNDQRLIQ